jgi:hypothetical protein
MSEPQYATSIAYPEGKGRIPERICRDEAFLRVRLLQCTRGFESSRPC